MSRVITFPSSKVKLELSMNDGSKREYDCTTDDFIVVSDKFECGDYSREIARIEWCAFCDSKDIAGFLITWDEVE